MSDQYVSLPRDLLLRLLSVYSTSPYPAWHELAAALEAAPAEDVRALGDEPVAFYDKVEDHLHIIGHVQLDDQEYLYRHPQRPVVLPDFNEWYARKVGVLGAESANRDKSVWNACIEEFEELNK